MLNTANTRSMMPPGTFRDKVFWVTGGGTGLGKSMTNYFAELGATVVITSRRQEVLDRTAEEINTSGVEGRVIGISGDVRESEVIEKLADEIFEKYGQLDVLVNNAAGNFISPTERLSSKAFDVVIDIVLKGTKNTTLAVGRKWIERRCGGVMLNITTTYAFTGSGYVVPSAIAKAGVLALTRSLAVEWAKYGIRQVAIAPGPFPTKGAWERLFPGGLDKKLNVINEIPLRRAGEHSELANLAAYLVSDYASFINGEVVVIDGGEWLQGAGEMNFLEALTPEQWDELAKFRK